VRTHPQTGRRAVFLGDHAERVQGMPYEAGRALIERLNAEIIHPDLVYRHHYRPGDLVAWDNRCVLHRATEYDAARERRVMRRCTVLGEVPA
jgi:alpha-ketoglutarate-dependent taurine dioxygenase